jgi:hypothetical protein
VAVWVNEHPDRLVLLGVHATEAEVEYGWIGPGRPLAPPPDIGIWEIRRFWEKPSEDTARLCLASGCLWNTLVLIGRASSSLLVAHHRGVWSLGVLLVIGSAMTPTASLVVLPTLAHLGGDQPRSSEANQGPAGATVPWVVAVTESCGRSRAVPAAIPGP